MNWLHARWPMMALMLVSVSVYLFAQVDQGWIPHDEGLLGQSATRVLDGQLPHVDFDDPYTGGQAMMHAAAMRLMGIDSMAMRWCLLGFSIAFAAVSFRIAERFVPSWGALIVTWIAVAWSVPNYFAPLPSWYNLFFAVGGTYALIRYDETNRRWWLGLAGVMGGLSFLMKVAGLYYLAAGILFLVYQDQVLARKRDAGSVDGEPVSERDAVVGPANDVADRVANDVADRDADRVANRVAELPIRTPVFTAFVAASLACFCGLLWVLVRSRLTLMDTIHFVMPGSLIAIFLVLHHWRFQSGDPVQGTSWDRMKRLTGVVITFLSGAAAAVLIFLIPYAAESGIAAWWDGVFIAPQKRMQFAAYPMPPVSSLLAVLPYALALIAPMVLPGCFRSIWIAMGAGFVSSVAVLIASQEPIYQFVWNGTRPLVPLIVVVGLVQLMRSQAGAETSGRDRTLFLLLTMTAMVSLVQFPYSFSIYFCYAIPIGVLALTAIVMKPPEPPVAFHLAVAMFFLGFAVVWLNHGRVQRIGVQYIAHDQQTVLDLPRSGLRVSDSQAKLYEQVITAVQEHSLDGSSIYATADCPEIYFLADRVNPTRSFYEFFEPDFDGDPAARVERIEAMLDENAIEVVVLHWNGEFSGRVPMDFAQMVATNFPNVEHFIRQTRLGPESEPAFSVAWRDLNP